MYYLSIFNFLLCISKAYIIYFINDFYVYYRFYQLYDHPEKLYVLGMFFTQKYKDLTIFKGLSI